jgi:glycosyltransferase involved in cell wall biosynthesis
VSDEQLEELYETSHLFVLPTLFEGMPTVVLEAMAKQLPIIVTDTGATAEQVDESNGFLIQKNNVPELKKALLKFYDLQSDKKNKMGLNSHQKVLQNFTWEKVAEKHHQLFKNILEQR